MKITVKIFSMFLVFVLLFSSLVVSAEILPAKTFSDLDLGPEGDQIVFSGEWAYVIFGRYITIVAYNGDAVNLVIPEKIDGYTVSGLVLHDKDYIDEVTDFPHFQNKIETLTLPKTLRYMEYDWFAGTPEADLYDPDVWESGTRFKELNHDDGTQYLEGYFDSLLPHLREFIVDEENKYFSSQDGVLFNKDKTVLISYPKMRQAKEYVVPETVKIIYDYALQGAPYFSDEVYEDWSNSSKTIYTFEKLVITKNVKKIGNFNSACCKTLVVDNVILDKKSINTFGAEKIIVYKDSPVHKYYKEFIESKNLSTPPKLVAVANPYAKEEPEKDKTSSKSVSSKNTSSKNTSSKTNQSPAPDTTESVVSKPEKTEETTESEVLTIGATESETTTENKNETKPEKSSNVWIIIAIAAAVVILAGGGTAYWFIRKKKKV